MSALNDADFVRRQHALCMLEMAGTAVLTQAIGDDDEVVSLAFTVTHQTDGLLVLEGEFRNAAGDAIAGFGL